MTDGKQYVDLDLAAGSTGGDLLFQATSAEMIEAYSHTPHPRGTVIASDVFSSGIIISDTDFGQFEQYLGVSGLDMAIVGHSYFYHTRKDISRNIERGGPQHFANNIIALVDYLLSPASPLLKVEEWSPPDIVYISLYDRVFAYWSMATADKAYIALAVAAVGITAASGVWRPWKSFVIALLGAPLGFLVCVGFGVITAGIMIVLDKQLRW